MSIPRRTQSDFYLLKTLRDEICIQAKNLKNGSAHRIVDFGCGSMPYATIFRPFCDEYIGCDLVGSNAPVEFLPGGRVPLENACADRVVSFQVLEHVHDVPWYFSEITRMLQADGVLILSTHGTWPYHPHPQDFWRWTRTGLVLELERNGFHVETIKSIVGPGAWTLMFQFGSIGLILKKFGFFGHFLEKTLNFLVSFLLPITDKLAPEKLSSNNSSVYLVVARKKSSPI